MSSGSDKRVSRRKFLELSGGALATGAAGLLGGCGGGGGSTSSTGGGTTGGTISDSQRIAVLSGAAQVTSGLAHTNFAADALTIQKYFVGQPTINATFIDADNNVWAHFYDGKITGVFNNMVPALSGQSKRANIIHPARAAELPASINATLFAAFGQGVVATGDSVAPWLKAVGYSVTINDAFGVEDLKSINASVGLFYVSAHGSVFPVSVDGSKYTRSAVNRGVTFNPSPVSFALSTSTQVSISNMLQYEADWGNGLMLPAIATTGVIKDGVGAIAAAPVWCVTEKFITQYMAFGTNSLVFFDTCQSYNNAAQTAVTSKSAAVYVGWTDSVNYLVSDKVTSTIFDELTGSNAYISAVPPERPFDFGSIYANLVSTGLYQSDPSHPNTKLMYYAATTGAGNAGQVTPSIAYVTVGGTTAAPYLYISGEFGTQPTTGATAFIYPSGAPANLPQGKGGAPLTILSWTPTEIRCSLPKTGGDVVVQAAGKFSNPRRLSEWKGAITYSGSGPDSHSEGFTMNLHILADIESYRTSVGQQLTGTNSLLTAAGFFTLPDATCTYSDGGGYNGKYETWSWTGGGDLSPGGLGISPGFHYEGSIDPVGKTMTLYYAIQVPGVVNVKYLDANGNVTGTGDGNLDLSTADFPNKRSGTTLGTLPFTLDSSLNIEAGGFSDSYSFQIDSDLVTTNTTLTWGQIPITSSTAPASSAARAAS